ncbi:SEC-C metal-binding domain-containing protein [Kushneria phosphatilytica]|uniref:Prepilin peptidase n=1 Tax=Kushneria phosphatilytica TaxID=657387 RepID=A0A1S1NUH3_9GAMM|nr:SEC-C metal-binding domain-containing protein [Kushneria phosphatilytica]OHV10009.1 prepilin peptidase [Kushneria phosphatilytica]QEL11691.1 prepilin peptidase [Kushneria phosphatilytica]
MSDIANTRTEKTIFKELELLCQSPGYVHVIAYLCIRDNTIRHSPSEVKLEDILQQFSMERLVRTELSTIVGLMCKKNIDNSLPSPDVFQEYIDKTDSLLLELHESMRPGMDRIFNTEEARKGEINPFQSGSILRESIFYGGESAYQFQYKDFSKLKYEKDDNWLVLNKGYNLDQAIKVITAIQDVHDEKLNNVFIDFAQKDPKEWTFLETFKFKTEEISNNSGVDTAVSQKVIESLTCYTDMACFQNLDDFNPINACPIIKVEDGEYLLFSVYSLFQAFYETPFFWFNEDKSYKNKAMQHRGEFTELFSKERLEIVFGEERVFCNIDIFDSGNQKVGEIDVLVLFSDRAIVLQAKSKKLTIEARKGNDLSLKSDFKKAVQDAYDQAFSCSRLILEGNCRFFDSQKEEIKISNDFKEIYPFCVVSDHYPALSFQAKQFLKQKQTNIIKPAFVMDIFFLDVLTEMLQSPLHFLSYIHRRVFYNEKVLSTHELTVLSYHLKTNLWIENDFSLIYLEDDICADLDLAMLSRREGLPGPKQVDGILTKYQGTHFEKLISDIEELERSDTIDFGFMMLAFGGDTIELINDSIDKIAEAVKYDGKHHDLTLVVSDQKAGLTIHCNNNSNHDAIQLLNRHCESRKYLQKADKWFGICIDPKTLKLRFGVNKVFPWKQSIEMDNLTRNFMPAKPIAANGRVNFKTKTITKIGRNEKCPCGSGKKYKKCCL